MTVLRYIKAIKLRNLRRVGALVGLCCGIIFLLAQCRGGLKWQKEKVRAHSFSALKKQETIRAEKFESVEVCGSGRLRIETPSKESYKLTTDVTLKLDEYARLRFMFLGLFQVGSLVLEKDAITATLNKQTLNYQYDFINRYSPLTLTLATFQDLLLGLRLWRYGHWAFQANAEGYALRASAGKSTQLEIVYNQDLLPTAFTATDNEASSELAIRYGPYYEDGWLRKVGIRCISPLARIELELTFKRRELAGE